MHGACRLCGGARAAGRLPTQREEEEEEEARVLPSVYFFGDGDERRMHSFVHLRTH